MFIFELTTMARCVEIEDTIQPLVSIATSRPPSSTSSSSPRAMEQPPKRPWFRRHPFFPRSKGAGMILLWNAIVGAVFGSVLCSIIGLGYNNRDPPAYKITLIVLGGYAVVALAQMLAYPVGGLISDLCCGRFRIVFLSFFKIWCGSVFACIISVIYISSHGESFHHHDNVEKKISIVLLVLVYISLVAGFTGFQANSVQFGLDQLLDSPSAELSVFLHWFVWTQSFGELLARLFACALPCNNYLMYKVSPYTGIVFTVVIGAVLFFSCCKRSWFHSEPHTLNPYGTVYNVLKYVAQHDKPVRRSAMTYCDDERPTRMEFAKERFGGPFTTETVEDVKTFLRILLMLFLVAPVFNLHVSTSYIFPLYGIHLGAEPIDTLYSCTAEWMLLQSGNLSFIITVVILPLYIILVLPHIPRLMPKILHRLLVGVIVMVATVAIMFAILVVAKKTVRQEIRNETKCLFLSEVRVDIENDSFTTPLNFHTSILIIPNILNGISVPLIYVTILEFISAQSPHTMKGLLLGIFYAFRGFFIMFGCLFAFFFVQDRWWQSTNTMLYDCGFSYYLTSSVLGLVGIVTVSIAVRCYHYRVRQDKPYERGYVEEIYQRYTSLASTMVENSEEEEPPMPVQIDTSILTYGTMVGT